MTKHHSDSMHDPEPLAPLSERLTLQCLVCKEAYDTGGQQTRSPWQILVPGVDNTQKYVVCRRCVEAGREARRNEAAPVAPPTAPTDEKGWVIERDINGRLFYWDGSDGKHGPAWKLNHMEAMRFARQVDANAMLTWYCGQEGRVVEHMWIAQSATARETGKEPVCIGPFGDAFDCPVHDPRKQPAPTETPQCDTDFVARVIARLPLGFATHLVPELEHLRAQISALQEERDALAKRLDMIERAGRV